MRCRLVTRKNFGNEGGLAVPSWKSTGFMNKIFLSFGVIPVLMVLVVADIFYGEAPKTDKVNIECQPTYGHYWQSRSFGWYGAKRAVRTTAEARDIIERFFGIHHRGLNMVRVGSVRERTCFFEAEIKNSRGMLVDMVIIDKRTGRIRSIF